MQSHTQHMTDYMTMSLALVGGIYTMQSSKKRECPLLINVCKLIFYYKPLSIYI